MPNNKRLLTYLQKLTWILLQFAQKPNVSRRDPQQRTPQSDQVVRFYVDLVYEEDPRVADHGLRHADLLIAQPFHYQLLSRTEPIVPVNVKHFLNDHFRGPGFGLPLLQQQGQDRGREHRVGFDALSSRQRHDFARRFSGFVEKQHFLLLLDISALR